MSAGGDLRVTYDRFQRSGAPSQIELQVEPQQEREVAIRISGKLLDAVAIERITPAPHAERSIAGGVELLFSAAAGEPLTVHLTVRPHSVGLVESEIGIGNSPPAELTQFIYP